MLIGFRVQGLGLQGLWGLGFGVAGLIGFRVKGLGLQGL